MSLATLDRAQLADGLAAAGADGWLLYDFRKLNPVAGRVLGLGGMGTRRIFVLLPREGEPVAVAHRIELGPLADFPGRVIPYSSWEELRAALGSVVEGRTLAMEISPDDHVPYLDRVPWGVIQLLISLGARIVPSGALVTQFAARWTADELADHRTAAEILARVARETIAQVVHLGGTGLRELEVQRRVVAACEAAGCVFDDLPNVSFGANAANPHYHPARGSDAELLPEQIVLIDLWAGMRAGGVFADQCWMGWAGATPPERVRRAWVAAHDAREAAITFLRRRHDAHEVVRGFEVDRAARAVLERAGYAANVFHRTGHSIDRDLHGSGPHLDDFETHDDRVLLPGVGFSIEPGVYFPGDFGIRTEVNGWWGAEGLLVTPAERQDALITAR